MPTNEREKVPPIKYKANVAEFQLTLPPDTKLINKNEMTDALTELTRKHIVPLGTSSSTAIGPQFHKARLKVSK
jgi:hypothetical protein